MDAEIPVIDLIRLGLDESRKSRLESPAFRLFRRWSGPGEDEPYV